jgi:hypothetical protein
MFRGRFAAELDFMAGLEQRSRQPGYEGELAHRDLANYQLAAAVHASDPAEIERYTREAITHWQRLLENAAPEDRGRLSAGETATVPEHVIAALSLAGSRRCRTGEAEGMIASIRACAAVDSSTDELVRISEGGLGYLSQAVATALRNAESGDSEPLAVAESLVDTTEPLAEILDELGEDAPGRYADLIDSVCLFLRGLAVDLHNKEHETELAIQIIELALDLSEDLTAEGLEDDLANLQEQLEGKRFIDHYRSLEMQPISSAPPLWTLWGCGLRVYGSSDYDRETSSYITNHYFTLLWIPIFPVGRYRVQALGENSYRFLGKVPFGASEKIHLVVGLLVSAIVAISVAVASGDNETGGRSGGTPNRPAPNPAPIRSNPVILPTFQLPTLVPPTIVLPRLITPTPDLRGAERERLRAQIDANNAKLDQLGAQVDTLDGTLANLEGQLASIQSQIDSIIRTYAVGNSLPEPQYSQYERLRGQYNAVVAQYNSTLDNRNALAREHDNLLGETNRLIDQYNSLR